MGASILFSNQWGDVGLDSTSPDADDDHGGDEPAKRSAILDRNGQRGAKEDDDSNQVDEGEVKDRVVFSEILIGDDSTPNWRNIAPELKEVIQTCGSLLALSNGARHTRGIVVRVLATTLVLSFQA